MNITFIKWLILILIFLLLYSCNEKKSAPSVTLIKDMNLKRGALISCGSTESQLGTVDFEISGNKKTNGDFNLGLKLLHSFEYDEAEKVFAAIIDEQPETAMAYWGIAMSNFHPLWTPPTAEELKKGSKAIEIAKSIQKKSERESAYIESIAAFYRDADKTDHRSRCINFEKAMEELNRKYPDDKETAIFYALSLNAAADPTDKTFSKQKKAGEILNSLYPGRPNHPGIVHYIIHTYDSPELAELALPAARKYANVAPSSAHALHMPSHIFTRLGLWTDCINSNLASMASAQCYADSAGIKGHWEEELHAMDYLMYGYLQKGENEQAKRHWDYLKTIDEVQPFNFKVAYAFASIPARYVLENKLWNEAAVLKSHKDDISWEKFPWQQAILNFTRLMGSVHLGKLDAARTELKELHRIHKKLLDEKDNYKANQVLIQIKASEAWMKFKEGNNKEALVLMNASADLEDKTEKHPVTPGEVIPARELLGDMLLQMNQPQKALEVYEAEIKKHPNRFNSTYSAGLAAERSGNHAKAKTYYERLLSFANKDKSPREEIKKINEYLKKV